jgi:hypothetical protein
MKKKDILGRRLLWEDSNIFVEIKPITSSSYTLEIGKFNTSPRVAGTIFHNKLIPLNDYLTNCVRVLKREYDLVENSFCPAINLQHVLIYFDSEEEILHIICHDSVIKLKRIEILSFKDFLQYRLNLM